MHSQSFNQNIIGDHQQLNVDYLIIGQGLCGTFLSYYLLQAGAKVLVIDANTPHTASKVASGVINPVTGRRIVCTWRIEELLPFAADAYISIGKMLDVDLLTHTSVLDFPATLQMKEAFAQRLTEEPEYLHKPAAFDWSAYFRFHFGVGEISPCLLIDNNTMLTKWRQYLTEKNSLRTEVFDWADCSIAEDVVSYKNITARKIICCEGIAGSQNPYFKNLPYSLNKGEALIVQIPGLPAQHIYKQGLSVVPWRDDLFWVGSSYEWNFTDAEPTSAFKEKVIAHLQYWLKLPLTVVDHLASVRPANMERRPFVGLHTSVQSVGILNGMGTKGCSLAPFFAHQFAGYLLYGKPLYADADVQRFSKILHRKMN